MGSGDLKKNTAAVKTALQRIEAAEKSIQALAGNDRWIVEGTQKSFTMVDQRLDIIEKMCNAFAECIGRDQVEEVLKRQIMDEATKRADSQKEAIAQALADGNLKVATTVDEKTGIICGRELLKDGETVRHPGWIQLIVSETQPEIVELLKGKTVGDKVEVPVGSFEVLEVYEFGDVKPELLEAAPVADELPDAELPEASEAAADQALDEYLATAPSGAAN